MILYISGLQNISAELYEVAKIDGANKAQCIWYITFPLVKPTTYLVITLGMINAFQIFDQIAAISKQSPLGSPAGSTSTVVTFLYQQSFSYMDMGYGSAAAMVLLSLIHISCRLGKPPAPRSPETAARRRKCPWPVCGVPALSLIHIWAANAAPPIPYGYSIARICSIRDCFFCLRTVHTDKISSIPNNTRMNRPISKTGNL